MAVLITRIKTFFAALFRKKTNYKCPVCGLESQDPYEIFEHINKEHKHNHQNEI